VQPLVFRVLEGERVSLQAAPLTIVDRCYRGAMAAHTLTGAYLMDLVVRWVDYEGWEWPMVPEGVDKDFRVARWLLPDDDPIPRLGLDTGGGWPTARRVWRARHFAIGLLTGAPYRTHSGDTNTPRHAIVERRWRGPHANWRDTIPAGDSRRRCRGMAPGRDRTPWSERAIRAASGRCRRRGAEPRSASIGPWAGRHSTEDASQTR